MDPDPGHPFGLPDLNECDGRLFPVWLESQEGKSASDEELRHHCHAYVRDVLFDYAWFAMASGNDRPPTDKKRRKMTRLLLANMLVKLRQKREWPANYPRYPRNVTPLKQVEMEQWE